MFYVFVATIPIPYIRPNQIWKEYSTNIAIEQDFLDFRYLLEFWNDYEIYAQIVNMGKISKFDKMPKMWCLCTVFF